MNNMYSVNIILFNAFNLALTLGLIILKLCNVITWSWWWTLFPLWLPLVLVLMFMAIGAIIGIMIAIWQDWREKDE